MATEYRRNRSVPDVNADVMTAWYGGKGTKIERNYPGITGRFIRKLIATCEKDMNEWIDKHGKTIAGTVGNISDVVQIGAAGAADDDEESGVSAGTTRRARTSEER